VKAYVNYHALKDGVFFRKSDKIAVNILESRGFIPLEFDGDYVISGRTIFDGEGWGEDWLTKTFDIDTINRVVDFNEEKSRRMLEE
jgi:hypothetical protein